MKMWTQLCLVFLFLGLVLADDEIDVIADLKAKLKAKGLDVDAALKAKIKIEGIDVDALVKAGLDEDDIVIIIAIKVEIELPENFRCKNIRCAEGFKCILGHCIRVKPCPPFRHHCCCDDCDDDDD
ncbi:hypothetical protein QR680_015704 [Steinernema hermaphroditum]|uniref:Uncharacterized protein n=1 Tax=Steinernema hermaphroditum TaxID=289476 RepID=A0AA39H9S0_9BILA|nr:hypothetical protein QR680_015704 [Steinernema hermaphroditum]